MSSVLLQLLSFVVLLQAHVSIIDVGWRGACLSACCACQPATKEPAFCPPAPPLRPDSSHPPPRPVCRCGMPGSTMCRPARSSTYTAKQVTRCLWPWLAFGRRLGECCWLLVAPQTACLPA